MLATHDFHIYTYILHTVEKCNPTNHEERIHALGTPRSHEPLGLKKSLDHTSLIWDLHSHLPSHLAFSHTSLDTTISNPKMRMMKQLLADRTSYVTAFNTLVKFQEASCAITAPSVSCLKCWWCFCLLAHELQSFCSESFQPTLSSLSYSSSSSISSSSSSSWFFIGATVPVLEPQLSLYNTHHHHHHHHHRS